VLLSKSIEPVYCALVEIFEQVDVGFENRNVWPEILIRVLASVYRFSTFLDALSVAFNKLAESVKSAEKTRLDFFCSAIWNNRRASGWA
jgi:hypothetical protein